MEWHQYRESHVSGTQEPCGVWTEASAVSYLSSWVLQEARTLGATRRNKTGLSEGKEAPKKEKKTPHRD